MILKGPAVDLLPDLHRAEAGKVQAPSQKQSPGKLVAGAPSLMLYAKDYGSFAVILA
jgi:hypothetical protein